MLIGCAGKKQSADLVVYNAAIYTVDSAFSVTQAMAIKDGKILETGTNEEIQNKYEAKKSFNADGKTILPGLIDAHCHFYAYGKGLQEVDLVGTKSWEEVLERSALFWKDNPENKLVTVKIAPEKQSWIFGRGWDQNDWDVKEYPTNEKLDSLFPDRPVLLMRIDGHAAIANSIALRIAGFNAATTMKGGEFIQKNGKLTGVLVDNAVDSIKKFIPPADMEAIKKALLAAQKNCFEVGLTTVDDAGLEKRIVDAIDQLNKSGELKMRIYAMLTPTKENLDHYLAKGVYKTDRLNVRSFKFYGDGALGSRGACMYEDYADKKGWKGFLLNDPAYFADQAERLARTDFQMNTHCIGDSAVGLMMAIYRNNLYNHCLDNSTQESEKHDRIKNRRWRIEHFQVFDQEDVEHFCTNIKSTIAHRKTLDMETSKVGIIPSVQPTHATSDMYWATDRIGKKRIKNAYAYKSLLNIFGMVALGTDFPVEDISPFKTFYAAVVRKDAKGFPEGGFQMENALSREETIRGMTIWAAYANFEEKEKGSLEPGKWADFVILDTDLMKCKEEEMLKTKVLYTYVGGEKVFGVNMN
jgi:hypothetical protein